MGQFSHGDKEMFRPIVDSLLTRDEYMLLGRFPLLRRRLARPPPTCSRTAARWTRMSDPQYGALRILLVRPYHPRVLRRDLERTAPVGHVIPDEAAWNRKYA